MNGRGRAPARHWAAIGENTCAAGIWFLWGVHRLLGRWPLRLVLYPVVVFHWARNRGAREASLEYLRRLHASRGVPMCAPETQPGLGHGLRHFISFAETIVDKLLAASGRYRFERVRYQGAEAMQALLASGRGGVLVTGHVGCLELCQAAAGRQPGLRLTVLVHTRHAERFNRVLRRLDPASPVRLLQVTEVDAATAVSLGERVANGEFIAIAGDRVPVNAGQTVMAPFLGHDAPFPVGAYVLAALFRCPLLMLGCVRVGRGHLVSFEVLAERVELPRAGREQALAAHAALFAGRLENLLVQAPYDWFNFFPFWAQPVARTAGRPEKHTPRTP